MELTAAIEALKSINSDEPIAFTLTQHIYKKEYQTGYLIGRKIIGLPVQKTVSNKDYGLN